MDPFFKELFEYSHLMNQKFITSFVDNQSKLSENSLRLMNHVLNAQHTWNSRIVNKESTAGVWYIHNTADLEKIDKFNFEDSIDILKHNKLDSQVEYITTKGEVFKNTIRDILFHVINHSTYHRGQMAVDFRNSGIEPVSGDFIFFKRQAVLSS
jgi:uncharacterized damage-inducible protein DinB